MNRIKRIQKHAIALAPAEQKIAFQKIDDFVQKGYEAAAASAKRVIYGTSPAEKKLRAWLNKGEPVVIELLALVKALKTTATFLRETGGMFGNKPQAATLPGHGLAGGSDGNKAGTSNAKPNGKSNSKQNANAKGGGGASSKGKAKVTAAPSSKVTNRRAIFLYEDGRFSIGKQTTTRAVCPSTHSVTSHA